MTNQNLVFDSFEELCAWAAFDAADIKPDCEGSPEEALMSGWIYAMDMQDEAKGALSQAELLSLAYSEFRNMGYHNG